MKIHDNRIFITGGCSGIGLALAEAFLAQRNKVIVCDRNAEKVEFVQTRYKELHTHLCDVTNINNVRQMMQVIEDKYGGVNVLVNNAGVIDSLRFADESSGIDEIFDPVYVNFIAPVMLTKLFIPVLLRHQEAAIINIGSALSFAPRPIAPLYCATKAAVHSLTRSLRAQLARTKIKVFEVLPPTVKTQMTEKSRVFKISPEAVASAVIKGLARDRYEIPIGYTLLLSWLYRIAPTWMDKFAALSIWERKMMSDKKERDIQARDVCATAQK